MKADESRSTPIFRYVLIVLAVKFAAGSVLAMYSYYTEKDTPNIGSFINIAAISLAMYIYNNQASRPMIWSDIAKFSISNAIVDLLFSGLWLIAMIRMIDGSFDWNGVNQALGGGDESTVKYILIAGMIIGFVQVFLVSVLFSWIASRKIESRETK